MKKNFRTEYLVCKNCINNIGAHDFFQIRKKYSVLFYFFKEPSAHLRLYQLFGP